MMCLFYFIDFFFSLYVTEVEDNANFCDLIIVLVIYREIHKQCEIEIFI